MSDIAELAHAEIDKSKPREHKVTVKVDGKPYHVLPGEYVVSAFKETVGVSPDRELDLIVGGEFRPLDDNATITIVGHETFVSHVRTGGSA